MSLKTFLAGAIVTQQHVAIEYDNKIRLIQPHRMNNVYLRAFQLHPDVGWKLFKVEKINEPTFPLPAHGYTPFDNQISEDIIAEVEA